MTTPTSLLLAGVFAASVIVPAHAGEGNFGWIYTLDLQPKGSFEFEQRLQLTRRQASGTYDYRRSRSELEYGLTDNVQISGYINATSITANRNYTNPEACGVAASSCTAGFGVPEGVTGRYSDAQIDGGSAEVIWRLTNPVTSPVGVGLYLDATYGRLANEYEARLLLQSNFLDDSLVLATNVVYEAEYLKFLDRPSREAMVDVLLGASYRFAPRWSAGLEYRFHNDFLGYNLDQHTQTAHFGGPNIHYAEKNFWVTAAWRHQFGGSCFGPGRAECSGGYVWDSHGREEFIVKLGIPLGD